MQKYSERLGVITDQQFQKALNTFNLGKFVKAEPITQGLFGQNVFITSDQGDFVLRGKPHYDWQFKTEKYFADLLHVQTNAPVPNPYLLELESDIFGWEFIIMPRMKGINLSDDLNEICFESFDRLEIADAQGKVLKETQRLTNALSGRFDCQINQIKPYEPNWITEFTRQILERLEQAAQYHSSTAKDDIEWVKDILASAAESIEEFKPTFFMQDFKPGNMSVDKINGIWKVTGLFDLMESSFGHPEADLSRIITVYLERKREDLAYSFLNSYLSEDMDINKFLKRFPLFMLHDRSIIWEWVQRTDSAWWDKSWSFRKWASVFLKIERKKIHY